MKYPIIILYLFFLLSSVSDAQQEKKSIYFDNDSFELTSASKLILKECTQIFDNAQYEIYGYSDSNGSNLYNLELSTKRAQSVKQFFNENGIDSINIPIILGKGENNKFEDLSKNRHVDVIIKKIVPIENEISLPTPLADTLKVANTTSSNNQPNNTKSLDNIINLKIGETLVLRHLQFYPGTDKPLPKALHDLNKLVQIMKDNPKLKIELQGHICCTVCDRSVEYTLKVEKSNELSIKRARYVYDFLIKKGIKKNRLTYKGFGSCKPRVDEINSDAMQMNRRVEVMVVEK